MKALLNLINYDYHFFYYFMGRNDNLDHSKAFACYNNLNSRNPDTRLWGWNIL